MGLDMLHVCTAVWSQVGLDLLYVCTAGWSPTALEEPPSLVQLGHADVPAHHFVHSSVREREKGGFYGKYREAT